MKFEQNADPVISVAKRAIETGEKITKGRLKRIQKQLRVEDGLLKKSSRLVVPASLRTYNLGEVHNPNHFGGDKTYALLQSRFY